MYLDTSESLLNAGISLSNYLKHKQPSPLYPVVSSSTSAGQQPLYTSDISPYLNVSRLTQTDVIDVITDNYECL